MCNKCCVSEFKLVNSIIENKSELQDTKHPVKETKAAIERKAPKVTKGKYTCDERLSIRNVAKRNFRIRVLFPYIIQSLQLCLFL